VYKLNTNQNPNEAQIYETPDESLNRGIPGTF
jgi:hypothetical protein